MTVSTAAIRMGDLQYRWHADTPVVLDIPEMQIGIGEKVFLVGPSGSGKSTLLNLLSGINAPTSGALDVLGHPLHALNGRQRDQVRADHLGVIFQQFNLLPYLNVIDNVILPVRLSHIRKQRLAQARPRDEARRLLKALHIDDALHEASVTALSVGQQQRVAAARAFMGSPALIIADEPTSALDADRQDAFIDLLMEQCRATGATLVFVSHHQGLAKRFDRMIPLRDIQRRPREVVDA